MSRFHEKNDYTNHTQLCAQGEDKGQFEQYSIKQIFKYYIDRGGRIRAA